MSGPYGREAYVRSLCPAGAQVAPLWGGHVLLRPLPGGAAGPVDAASAYPLGGFDRNAGVEAGLAELRARGAVALTVVPDPLNAPPPDRLRPLADVYRRLKTHYLLDHAAGPFDPGRHHRQEIRRAGRRCSVETVGLGEVMADWLDLYGQLGDRHGIDEGARLAPPHFDWLARDPQAFVFAARVEGAVVAMSIWLSDGEIAHNHLGASSAAGYRVGASYALYAAAVERFADHRVLDFGGMPGLVDDPEHGLARFKRGFANAEIATVLAGFVLDRAGYDAAVAARVTPPAADFFPAYRAPPRPA